MTRPNKILAPGEDGDGASAAWQRTTSARALKIRPSTDKKVTASCTYDLLLKHTFFLEPGNVLKALININMAVGRRHSLDLCYENQPAMGAGFQYDPKEQSHGPTAPWVKLDRGVNPNFLFCCSSNIPREHPEQWGCP